jgi:Ca2+-transporting ATPase
MDAGALVDPGRPMVAVRHGRLAGRTRLRLASPRSAKARKLHVAVEALNRCPGIRRVAHNESVMSVLVEHDPALTPEAVAEVVRTALLGGPHGEEGARTAPKSALHPREPEARWHARSRQSALRAFASRNAGLTTNEAAARLAGEGPNALPEQGGRRGSEIFIGQFRSLPVWLLLGSAALSLATGGLIEAVVTVAVVALNAGIGFSTESWTERLIRSTQSEELTAPVWRDGEIVTVDARAIARGDILALSTGVSVAADARLLETDELAVDESLLTGESFPAQKDAEARAPFDAPLSARASMVHRGAMVSGGRGSAVVTAIGPDTEIGLVQRMLSRARPPQAPMDRALERLSVRLTAASLIAGFAVMALLRARGAAWVGVVRSGVSLAVAAIPEGLPAIAATAKAIAARALAKRGALVRNLSVIETAGAVDMLCLDKTGTLTKNRMAATVVRTVRRRHRIDPDTHAAAPALGPDSSLLARVAILCNDAEVRLAGEPAGSGTESALLALAVTGGFDLNELRAQSPRLDAWYRNRDRSYMATEHAGPDGPHIAVKGAPEQVLALCATALVGGEAKPLTASLRRTILAQNEELAAEGLRVLGFAQTTNGTLKDGELNALHWLGLVGLSDPLRPGAAQLVASFQRAGIRPLILTGDQATTARALAEELGLASDGSLNVVDASALAGMSAREIARVAQTTEVFARVSPADKLRIVQALQAEGRVVAMTGDGVNDGPALRAADIGLAMGKSGSQTAKDVADIVIADDGLAGVAAFLAHARTAEVNIRRSLRFLVGTNLSETLLLVLEASRGAREVEGPLEILWLNLVTDVFPALGLALAPPAEDVLGRPPRTGESVLFDRGAATTLACDAAAVTAPALASHLVGAAKYGLGPQARGMTFLTMASAQLAHTLTLAPKRKTENVGGVLLRRGVESGIAASAALMLAPYAFPALGRTIGVAAPRGGDLLLALALGAAPLLREAPRIVARLRQSIFRRSGNQSDVAPPR